MHQINVQFSSRVVLQDALGVSAARRGGKLKTSGLAESWALQRASTF
jgi:hypothetical protein